MCIALITPTGARPDQFALCAKWMKAQTYKKQVLWIIVDDYFPYTTTCINDNFREGWEIIRIYPEPRWVPGQNTQSRNIAAGIEEVKKHDVEAIFIIEDDDYYRPVYLERMMANFNGYSLIGERNTLYYNVACRRHVRNPNTVHASLFQTAFKPDLISIFAECMKHNFIDYVFWNNAKIGHLFYENDLAIGIKGMPGRGGIGAGHSGMMRMSADISLKYLISLIGYEDAKLYEKYYQDIAKSRQPLFVTHRL